MNRWNLLQHAGNVMGDVRQLLFLILMVICNRIQLFDFETRLGEFLPW